MELENGRPGIEDALRAHVVQSYAVGTDVGELDADHDLLVSGLVDSMGVMEIIGFVEETFGVVVEDDEIVPENFRSLRAMSDYVAAKQAAGAAETSESASP